MARRDPDKVRKAAMLWVTKKSVRDIAKELGVTAAAISGWKKTPEWQATVSALSAPPEGLLQDSYPYIRDLAQWHNAARLLAQEQLQIFRLLSELVQKALQECLEDSSASSAVAQNKNLPAFINCMVSLEQSIIDGMDENLAVSDLLEQLVADTKQRQR